MRTQLLVAEYWKPLYPMAQSTGAGRTGKDVLNTPGLWLEVKARSKFEPVSALKQAKEADLFNEIPMFVYRPNGVGETRVGEWLVTMRQVDARHLVGLAGYGG